MILSNCHRSRGIKKLPVGIHSSYIFRHNTSLRTDHDDEPPRITEGLVIDIPIMNPPTQYEVTFQQSNLIATVNSRERFLHG